MCECLCVCVFIKNMVFSFNISKYLFIICYKDQFVLDNSIA